MSDFTIIAILVIVAVVLVSSILVVLNVFHIDDGYVLSTAQQSALDQTLRVSLGFDLEGLRDLVGGGRRR